MAQSGRPKKVDPKVDSLRGDIGRGDYDFAKITLTEFGVDVQDGDGRTALINSILERKNDFVQFLLDSGADVNLQDKSGYSALHFAGQERLLEICKALLKHNANLELRDRHGNTPLWTAVLNGRRDLDVVRLLLKAGANRHNVNNAGRTPHQMINTMYGESFDFGLE